jgi:glycine betaine/proline transport system substrate-binding protein
MASEIIESSDSSIQNPEEPILVGENAKASHKFVSLILLSGFLLGIFALIGYIIFVRNTNVPQTTVKPVIKLAVNPWKAAELNAAIAKIILEEKMGYRVELVRIDENSQWDALAKGDLHASLEVWPSGHTVNMKRFITAEKTVEDGGPLGPVGKIGWFMPTELLKRYPVLASWQGLKDPKNAALFATSPGGKGQFLTGDPSWVQYDEQIINNLGLNFEVKELGSEDALIQAVDTAYKKKTPILFYFWTPHWAHAIYDLTPVTLPQYTDDCYENTKGGVNCDYPAEQLRKVFSAELKDYAPEVYQFLKKFTYTNKDQITMLAAVQQKKQSVDEVARYWVQNNESLWEPWLLSPTELR